MSPIRDARRRGSLLILTVVVLVLMIIMGAAYMQVARTDRLATRRNENSNLELVINGEIAALKKAITDDLFIHKVTAPPDVSDNANDSMYDYPWTNPDSADLENAWSVKDFAGNNQPAYGGHGDDRILAAMVPDFPAPGDVNAVWSHLSNQEGIRLDLPAANQGVAAPFENVINFSDGDHTDTNLLVSYLAAPRTVTTYDPRGADADGDGVLDSFWTWAPQGVRQLGENAYVVSVRMIDLSGLINLNAGTALTSDGATLGTMTGDPTTDTSSRGYYPTDNDLSRFFIYAMQSAHFAELGNVLRLRNIPYASLPTTRQARDDAWLNTVRLYGATGNRFVMADEMELRYRNGLNNSLSKADLEKAVADGVVFDRMPGLTRNTPTATENAYNSVTGITSLEDFYHGGSTANNVYDAARQYNAVRHMLTTYSGASALAQNFGATNGTNRDQYDLVNPGPTLNTGALRIDAVRQRVAAILKLTPVYLGLTSADADNIAADFAVAMEDYSDADHTPSLYTDAGGVKHYGLETLPFLREVYAQFGYDDTDKLDGSGNPGTDGSYDTWHRNDGSIAMAIEIGNPFDKTIDFSATPIRIVVFKDEAASGYNAATDTAYTIVSGTLASRAKAVVVSNPATPVVEGTNGTDLVADLGIATPISAGSGALKIPAPPTGATLVVGLQVEVGAGNWVTYDRLRLPTDYVETAGNPALPDITHVPDAAQHNIHVQASYARDGRKLHYLSNGDINYVAPPRYAPVVGATPPATPDYHNTAGANRVEALGSDTKGSITNADTTLDDFQIPLADRPFVSLAELGWVQMFGFTDEKSSGQYSGDFPERMKTLAATPARRNLDFSATAQVATASGLPHAAMVVSQFTTLSPLHDGVDNANDDRDNNSATGADGAKEKFVPGTINVNTAPLHVLTFAAPLPETVDNIQALMKEVIAYRDAPGGRSAQTGGGLAGLRTKPGVATLGELMYLHPSGATPSTNQDMQWYGNDTADNSTTAVDLYPKPEDVTAGTAVRIASKDTAEEKLARFQFLSQTFTTRSDIYAAYVIVRGYPSANFSSGIAEEAQFCVILDRSGVNSRSDTPKILGFYRLR